APSLRQAIHSAPRTNVRGEDGRGSRRRRLSRAARDPPRTEDRRRVPPRPERHLGLARPPTRLGDDRRARALRRPAAGRWSLGRDDRPPRRRAPFVLPPPDAARCTRRQPGGRARAATPDATPAADTVARRGGAT